MSSEASVFLEVGDRCWVARHEYLDVNISLVAGAAGVLVVDTLWSERAAVQVAEVVASLGHGEVVGVVNTHHHFDHVLGNAAFVARRLDLPVHAHEDAAALMGQHVADIKSQVAASTEEPYGDDICAAQVLVPEHTFSSVTAVDLGDRSVELVHPGRGHTAGDVVVKVPDADVLFAGDLVEESVARGGVPGYGSDCFPMEWPTSLDLVLSLVGDSSVVVPGHGAPVDKDFVYEQRSAIGVVAETIRDLAGRGVPLRQALEAAEWPYPREELAAAVRRGYEQLPRSSKRLPLI